MRITQEAGKQPAELSDAFLAIDRAVLDALNRASLLRDVLTVLCRAVEEQSPGLLCSILLLDESQTHLLHGAAPSLPDSYNRAIHGAAIGPRAGSCGTAVHRQEVVIVSDIASDPLWADYRELALPNGLRACWSSPIASRSGRVLGTFAIYYREPRLPTERERYLIGWATQLAGLAIESKQADDALRKQREELQIILDSVPAMIWYKDKENKILRANQAAADSMGLQKHELEGRSVYQLFPQEGAKYHQDDLEVIRSGKPKLGIREPYRTGASEERWVITDKIPYRDLDGNIIGVIVFARDVTEQHRAEAALRDAEFRFRTLVEQLPAIIYIAEYGAAGHWSFVSSRIQDLLGFSPEEWVADAEAWANRLHPEDRARVLAEEARSRADEVNFLSEYRMLAREGRVVWFRDEATVVHDKAGKPWRMQGVMLDITERKKLEEQLRQAQKMEAVGRLAGGVAHDFNNLLMVILGYNEMLLESLPAGAPQRRSADEIKRASDRAAALTRQLLAFGRMQVLQPRVLNLNTLVAEMGEMIRRLIGADIELILSTDKNLGRVKADQSQIEQVILNLAVNARDAMPDGGKLIIETANVEVDENTAAKLPPMIPGRYALLTVTDTGIGMDAQTKTHIFEPFFTTKERGKGTGLGLAMVYGIVKQSGGWIWVSSEPGQGASFKIYLPRVAAETEDVMKSKTHRGDYKGTETVLLVEDEEGIRELLTEYLRGSGYSVLSAKDGSEALGMATACKGDIHIVVADVVMPNMGGRELAAKLRSSHPHIKVLFISGYAEYTPIQNRENNRSEAFLQKPFALESLCRRMREVLEQPPT